MMHWAAEYVGKAHQHGGRGPEVFDCWGLLKWIYMHRYGIALPDLPGISSKQAIAISKQINKSVEEEWFPVEKPFDGCAVALAQVRSYHHVGIWIDADGGKVLHCYDDQRVIVDTVKQLQLKGFRKVDFFKHKKWPT